MHTCYACGQPLPARHPHAPPPAPLVRVPRIPDLTPKDMSGPWEVLALARDGNVAQAALEALEGAGGRTEVRTRREDLSGLWKASVRCQGIREAERLAAVAWGAGAAAACIPRSR